MSIQKKIIITDDWSKLRNLTQARISLGRVGVAIPLTETLNFRMAHANARDAVYSNLSLSMLHDNISQLGLDCVDVQSLVSNRDEYLRRPDLGRSLCDDSVKLLESLNSSAVDIAIVVSDGLSATAVNENCISLLEKLQFINSKFQYSWSPIVIVQNGRVAIADEIAYLFKARIVLHLIGERPGLTSYNSLGAYITYQPRKGLTDESRNCISNIRKEGLPIDIAAQKIIYMINESLRKGISGVHLKDTFSEKKLLD